MTSIDKGVNPADNSLSYQNLLTSADVSISSSSRNNFDGKRGTTFMSLFKNRLRSNQGKNPEKISSVFKVPTDSQ